MGNHNVVLVIGDVTSEHIEFKYANRFECIRTIENFDQKQHIQPKLKMKPSEIEGLEFAVQVLQKALVSKDNDIQQIKESSQIQIDTLFKEIDQRDQEIDQLKNEIDAIKSMQENNHVHIQNLKQKHAHEIHQLNVESRRLIEKLRDHKNELSSANHQVERYKELSNRQANNVAELSKLIEDYRRKESDRNHADQVIFEYVQDRYGCKAVWDLADLNLGFFKEHRPIFQLKKRSNLVIRKNGQSAYYIDLHRRRFNICLHCVDRLGLRFDNLERTRSCLAGKWDFYTGFERFHCSAGKTCRQNKTNECPWLHCDLE